VVCSDAVSAIADDSIGCRRYLLRVDIIKRRFKLKILDFVLEDVRFGRTGRRGRGWGRALNILRGDKIVFNTLAVILSGRSSRTGAFDKVPFESAIVTIAGEDASVFANKCHIMLFRP